MKNLQDPNYLWNTLSHIRAKEQDRLNAKEQELFAKERELQRSLRNIETEVNQQLSRQKTAAFFTPLLNTILRQRFSPAEIEAFTTKGQSLRKALAAFQSVTGFVSLALLVFLLAYLNHPDKFPFLNTPAEMGIALKFLWQDAQALLNKTGLPQVAQPWIAALLPLAPLLYNYLEAVQKEQARIQEEREILLTEKSSKTNPIAKEIAQLKLQVQEQRQRIGIVASHPSLLDFVNSRLDEDAYGQHLGLMKQIQQDLEDLSQQLTPGPHNEADLQKLFPRGPARVVVYIDDLDRCPPNRVVEVLEAVQLLLKHELFIVVLAIDDRYIARALEEVYQGVLKRRGIPSGIDYLEKIIQIPYRMRPISPTNVAAYLQSQVEVRQPEQAQTEAPPPQETPPSSEAY